MNGSLATAARLGAVTGLRSMTGLAWMSHSLSCHRGYRRRNRLERFLAADTVALVLSGLAVGEIVADKFPGIPDRVSPGPLVGRAVIGGMLGALAGGRHVRVRAAAVGASAALATAFVGWLARTRVRRLGAPDAVVAVLEDAVAVTSARGTGSRL